jgi:hypothetical protein
MRIRLVDSTALVFVALAGCVSGPPSLTSEQSVKLGALRAYRVGEAPEKPYQSVGSLSSADCSGAPAGGRVWGRAEIVVESLKKKAVAANADAVINVSCGAVPLLNNCWAAERCTGDAIVFK